jgi:hypothetical protein
VRISLRNLNFKRKGVLEKGATLNHILEVVILDNSGEEQLKTIFGIELKKLIRLDEKKFICIYQDVYSGNFAGILGWWK